MKKFLLSLAAVLGMGAFAFAGDGSLASPYTAQEAADLTAALEADVKTDAVYVSGKISEIGSIDTGQYGNATFYISDNGQTEGQFYIFRAYYLEKAKFTAANQIKVGDDVVVYGQLVNYKGNTPEMTSGGYIYSLNGETSAPEQGGNDDPVTPPTGAGTEAQPYTVAEAIAVYETQEAATKGWVMGYIVGSASGNSINDAAFGSYDSATNLILAPSKDCKDKALCIPVQLPAGDVRAALNLQDNPVNMNALVQIEGSIEKYFGVAGLKSCSAYKILEAGNGEAPVEKDDINNTPETAYTVAAIEAIINADNYQATNTVYVAGVITEIQEVSLQYGNATFILSDEGKDTGIKVFRAKYLDGEAFTAEDQIKVGDKVVVEGKAMAYNGEPQIGSAKLYSLNGQTGIESVAAEAGVAAYYNLQGVRVLNPAQGQVYIRVLNGKAAKIVK